MPRLIGLEGRVDLGAEELAVPEAAGQSVAVLAAHRAAELDHQVGDLAGDRPQGRHAFCGLDVDDRPDVQAADVGMPVAGRRDAVPLDDPAKAVVKLGKPAGVDGRVLDERDRLGVADHAHQQRKAGLAHLPEVVLVGVRQAACARPGRPAGPRTSRPAFGALGQLVGANRRRTGRRERPPAGRRRSRDAARTTGSARPGRGSSGRASRRRPDRSRRSRPAGRAPPGSWRTTARPAPGPAGSGTSLQHGGGGDRQRPFRADDQLGQVELPGLVAPAGRPHRQARARTRRGCSRSPGAGCAETGRGSPARCAATVSRTTR